MKNNEPMRLLGVRDDFRKVNYEEYKDSCTKELLQQFLDGKLDEDTPEETLRGLMYGYTFTDEYAQSPHFLDSPFSIRYWKNIIFAGMPDDRIFSYQCQIAQILDTILSTGDGKTRKTAFCVIDVYQEYELMDEIFEYYMPEIARQKIEGGIDCIEFKPNVFGVKKLYFDVHRRLDVGYPYPRPPKQNVEEDINE